MINKALVVDGVSQSNDDVWRIVKDIIIKGSSTDTTYTLQNIAELPIDTFVDNCTLEDVRSIIKGYVLAEDLTEAEVDLICGLYPEWDANHTEVYLIDTLLSWNLSLYKVLQEHIPQTDWEPQNVPALFVIAYPSNVIASWVQPTGGHDAYNIGDKVLFNDLIYESLIDANVWSPTVYPAGWQVIE